MSEEQTPLPPLPDEAFDGERESVKIEFVTCKHELTAVSSTMARCTHCTACWTGPNIADLIKASQSA